MGQSIYPKDFDLEDYIERLREESPPKRKRRQRKEDQELHMEFFDLEAFDPHAS